MCYVSRIACNLCFYKFVELIGGGAVINEAILFSFSGGGELAEGWSVINGTTCLVWKLVEPFLTPWQNKYVKTT